MTPKERAKDATCEAGMPNWGSNDQEQLEMAVEQAINAAVEEARREQASVTAKAERDECLKILQKTYEEWVDGDYAPGEAFESARDRIRARSNKPDGGTK